MSYSGRRSTSRGIALALLALAPVGLGLQAQQENKPVVTIGMIYDGPPPDPDAVAFRPFWKLPEQTRSEIEALTGREFDVRFPEDKRLLGDWDVAKIHQQVDQLLQDPEVDLVLTMGVFSSNDVLRRAELPKPVIAPFAVDVYAQSLPLTEDGTSGVKNLNYLIRAGNVAQDLRKFRELVPFSKLHVIVDSLFMESITELPEYAKRSAETIEADATLVPVDASADDALSALDDAEAVYVTPMLRLPSREFDRLVDGLIERKLPSFSLRGEIEVELGLLACLRRTADASRIARRVALNVRRILKGEDASTLPVVLDQPEKLLLNLETANAIGFYPRWKIALQADTVGNEGPWQHEFAAGESLTMADAVQQAVRANLPLRAADRGVVGSLENIRRARSFWKPQFEAKLDALLIDKDRARASFGAQPERSFSAGVAGSQVLYSEPVAANIAIAKLGQRAFELDWQSLRLDVALEAADSFLNVLRARTLEDVERRNVELTEENLELARRREAVGFSGPADVYRWESQLATDRAALIAAHNRFHIALIQLNRVMDRELSDLYAAQIPAIGDPKLVTGFGRLGRYVDTTAGFELFQQFSVTEGLERAPELQAVSSLIAAEERQLLADRRSYWVPDMLFLGDFARRLAESGEGSDASMSPIPDLTTDRDVWSLALTARLPLYSGGERKANRRQSTEEVARLRLEHDALEQVVEQRIRTALYQVASTFPAIDLSRQAADAAKKNLSLVSDSYSRGAVSVINLIDAQNQAFIAELFASNAIYNFLIDLMQLQRAASDFDFFRSEQQRKAWFERLDAFFREQGFPVSQVGER